MDADLRLGVALALGQLSPALRSLVVSGRNSAVGSTEEDVWEGGGSYSFLQGASALEVVSSSASDAAAGTGARTVRFTLLDANGDEQSVSLTLNGTTPVPVGTYLRVNGGLVLSAGSSGSNVGIITLRTVSGSVAQLVIGAGRGYQSQFIYTVPRGYSAIVGTFFFSTEQADGGQQGQSNTTLLTFLARFSGSGAWLRLAAFSASEANATTELRPSPPASVLPALTDFRFAAQCLTEDMRVNCGMTIMLAKDGVNFAPRFAWAGG